MLWRHLCENDKMKSLLEMHILFYNFTIFRVQYSRYHECAVCASATGLKRFPWQELVLLPSYLMYRRKIAECAEDTMIHKNINLVKCIVISWKIGDALASHSNFAFLKTVSELVSECNEHKNDWKLEINKMNCMNVLLFLAFFFVLYQICAHV